MQYLDLAQWQEYLLKGILIFITIASSAVVLTRTGRSPYLAFLMTPVPYMPILAVWALAFFIWYGERKR